MTTAIKKQDASALSWAQNKKGTVFTAESAAPGVRGQKKGQWQIGDLRPKRKDGKPDPAATGDAMRYRLIGPPSLCPEGLRFATLDEAKKHAEELESGRAIGNRQ